MRRFVRILLKCVAFGVIVTVVVAFFCALYSPLPPSNRHDSSMAEQMLRDRFTLDERGAINFHCSRSQSSGREFVHASCVQIPVPDQPHLLTAVNLCDHGWPLMCFRGENRFGTGVPDAGLHWAIVAPKWLRPTCHMIGFRPLPGPFVANVLMFGSVVWLPWQFFVWMRTWLRKALGRCPVCGYDLRRAVVDGCSECGWNRTTG